MKSSSRRFQGGLAMVEFAIVLPLLLVLMFGSAEFGRAFYQFNTLAKAVRTGARYYAKQENVYVGITVQENEAGKTRARNVVVYGAPGGGGTSVLPTLAPGDVTVTIDNDATGTYATVSAEYTFQFLDGNPLAGIVSLIGGEIGTELTMHATSAMRVI